MNTHCISILVASVLCAAASAWSEIVYVDPPDTTVTLTSPCGYLLDIDIDRDGQRDYGLWGCEVEGSPGYRYISVFDSENWVGSFDPDHVRGFREGETISYESGSWTQGGWILSNRGDGDWASGEALFLGFYL